MAHVLVKNFSANTFGYIVLTVSTLALVPLYLTHWGVHLYGEWLVVSALPTYFMATADAGLVPVAGNDMTIKLAQGRRDEVIATFQSSWLFTSALSAFITAGVIGAASIFSIRGLLGLSVMPDSEATAVFICLLVVLLFNIQQGIAQVSLRAIGRFAEGTVANNSIRLLEAAGIAVTLLLGGSPAGVAAVMVICRLGAIVVGLVLLKRYAPWLHYGNALARWSEIRRLLVPSIAAFGVVMGNATMSDGVTLVLNHTVGPAGVALFVTTRTMTRFGIQMISQFSWSSWPEISRHYGGGNTDRLAAFLTHGTQLASIVAAGLAVVFIAGAPIIFAVWTAGRIEPDRGLVALLALGAGATTLRAFPATMLLATNRHVGFAGGYLLICLISVIICYPASLQFHLLGAGGVVAAGEIAVLVLSMTLVLALIGRGLAPLRQILTTRPPIERLFKRRSKTPDKDAATASQT